MVFFQHAGFPGLQFLRKVQFSMHPFMALPAEPGQVHQSIAAVFAPWNDVVINLNLSLTHQAAAGLHVADSRFHISISF